MRFARVEDGAIVESGNRLPSGSRLPNGAWMTPYMREWSAQQMAAVGWFDVVQSDKPEGYADSALDLVAGVPTMVWVSRSATVEELASLAADAARVSRAAAVTDAVVALGPIAAQGGANADLASVAASLLAVIASLTDSV